MFTDSQNPFVTDENLVKKLWEGNEDAWKYILCRTVIPMSREERYYRIMADRQISTLDVLGMLFDVLISRKKLSLFQFRCPLFLWVRHYVTKEIYDFLQKNRRTVSDDDINGILIAESTSRPLDEEREVAQRCFKQLWRMNPAKAYVHLLMAKDGLSAKEVMDLLSISSEDNVYQMHSRAITDMQSIRHEIEQENHR